MAEFEKQHKVVLRDLYFIACLYSMKRLWRHAITTHHLLESLILFSLVLWLPNVNAIIALNVTLIYEGHCASKFLVLSLVFNPVWLP